MLCNHTQLLKKDDVSGTGSLVWVQQLSQVLDLSSLDNLSLNASVLTDFLDTSVSGGTQITVN